MPRLSALLVLLLLLAACGDATERPAGGPPDAGADTTSTDARDVAAPDAGEAPVEGERPARDTLVMRADAPLERRPTAPIRIDGACPFECCTYGRWTTSGSTRIFARPTPTAPVVHRVPAGTELDVATGHVVVNSLARWVLRQPIEGYIDYQTHRTLPAGDTLVVLDYVGEGVYRAWHDGTVYQVEGVSAQMGADSSRHAVRQLGQARRQWWARVRTPGREGWLWMDETPPVQGADACG